MAMLLVLGATLHSASAQAQPDPYERYRMYNDEYYSGLYDEDGVIEDDWYYDSYRDAEPYDYWYDDYGWYDDSPYYSGLYDDEGDDDDWFFDSYDTFDNDWWD
jgi:hypothetical protein